MTACSNESEAQQTGKRAIRQPSVVEVLVPLIAMIVLMAAAVILFGDSSSYGPNQIALLFSAGIAAVIGLKNGLEWSQIEAAMIRGISISLSACLILLAVGSLIGTWMLSGTVPSLIYYGLSILSPEWFYAASCLICALVAVSIGSSWTTAATVGVALMGVASGMQLSLEIAAGAVVSGAYFGDKMSPLSETTNLAPAIAGTELFAHIQYMLWTTVPSFVLAVVLFAIIGNTADQGLATGSLQQMQQELQQAFDISLWMLLPLAFLLAMAYFKMPAFPAVFLGALIGGVWALWFQAPMIDTLSNNQDLVAHIAVIWQALFDGVSIQTGNQALDELLSRGGMSSMLNTIWLIICAMCFGSVLERTGILNRIVVFLCAGVDKAGSLITRTILTAIGTNVITADQYIAIVMPGRMFKSAYEQQGLDRLNLSRSLEDGGTLTSALIPWNTCGAYMHSVLMVHPLAYGAFAFFNWINPLLAIVYAYLGIKILRLSPPTIDQTKAAQQVV